MRFYLNNCRSRDHAALYGRDAFYDLYLNRTPSEMTKNIKPNDECIVASTLPNGKIAFNWFTFTNEAIRPIPDEPGINARVFFGRLIKSEIIPKATATKTSPYSVFFNVKGHFKRVSVILPRELKRTT